MAGCISVMGSTNALDPNVLRIRGCACLGRGGSRSGTTQSSLLSSCILAANYTSSLSNPVCKVASPHHFPLRVTTVCCLSLILLSRWCKSGVTWLKSVKLHQCRTIGEQGIFVSDPLLPCMLCHHFHQCKVSIKHSHCDIWCKRWHNVRGYGN